MNVLIGIQQRSTSTRFPNKAEAKINGKSITRFVIDACQSAEDFVNQKVGYKVCQTALLVPFGDPLVDLYGDHLPVIEGPEDDVLTRYHDAVMSCGADAVVRVTGDCPLIPAFVISKMIHLGMARNYDYLSNVDEDARTAPDGWDCEFISSGLISWLQKQDLSSEDREHVTTAIRSQRVKTHGFTKGVLIGWMDMSAVKISVDTDEDLKKVEAEYLKVQDKLKRAMQKYLRRNIHRI